MGNFAAGAGAYNEQTAQARSTNAQTAMQVNEYMYQCQQRRNRSEAELMAQRQQVVNQTAETNYNRILDNPDPHDIHVGDAENLVLNQLLDPKVFAKVIQLAEQQPISSSIVKSLPLSYAPQGLTVCLEEYTVGGAPDILLTSPAFATERTQLRALAKQARQEAESQGSPAPETMAQAREVLKAVESKIGTSIQDNTPDRQAAEEYVKGLYGLTKMLQKPDIATYLRGLENVDSTTLGHLISFMHSFSLKFGAAKDPEQQAAYDQLYPMLVSVRDAAIAPGQAASPFTASSAPAPPPKIGQFFSAMQPDHLSTPPPPSPGQ